MAGGRLLNLAVVVTLLLATAGCRRGGGSGDGPQVTIPTVPGTAQTVPDVPTTTSTSAPSYAVPDVIDAAYVETVMKALDHVYGDAIRIMARDRALTNEFLEHLLPIYTDKEFDLVQELWIRDLASGLRQLSPNPGDPSTTIQRLTRTTRSCVVAAVVRDFSPTITGTANKTPQRYVGLIPKPADRDPFKINPTPWIMSFDGFIESGSEPEEPCLPD